MGRDGFNLLEPLLCFSKTDEVINTHVTHELKDVSLSRSVSKYG